MYGIMQLYVGEKQEQMWICSMTARKQDGNMGKFCLKLEKRIFVYKWMHLEDILVILLYKWTFLFMDLEDIMVKIWLSQNETWEKIEDIDFRKWRRWQSTCLEEMSIHQEVILLIILGKF